MLTLRRRLLLSSGGDRVMDAAVESPAMHLTHCVFVWIVCVDMRGFCSSLSGFLASVYSASKHSPTSYQVQARRSSSSKPSIRSSAGVYHQIRHKNQDHEVWMCKAIGGTMILYFPITALRSGTCARGTQSHL